MYSSDRRQVTSSSISPFRAISLLDARWKCLHQEQWSNQHHEFFIKTSNFCKSTILKCQPTTAIQNKRPSKILDPIHWILELNPSELIGRFTLQIISSDFRHGILFIDLDIVPNQIDVMPIISQLISSIFLSLSVDTQKIIAMSQASERALSTIPQLKANQIGVILDSSLPSFERISSYDTDKMSWLESECGKASLESLSWLQKRVTRMKSIESLHSKPEKTSWIFSVLTLGRRRKTREPMVHPLIQFRKKWD
jgi:hypothetical protein